MVASARWKAAGLSLAWCGALRAQGLPLLASVASSAPLQTEAGSTVAPTVFGFRTSAQAFYSRFALELRVVFLPAAGQGHVADLQGAPLSTCHDLLAEVSLHFPQPLDCFSGNFSDAGGTDRYFGFRFGSHDTFQPGTSYSFVIPSMRLLASGHSVDFVWRLEFRHTSGDFLESVEATLEHDVYEQPVGASCPGRLSRFLVRGGQDMDLGAERELQFFFAFGNDLGNRSAHFLVTLFPMSLWNQSSSTCSAHPPGIHCEFRRGSAALGYNQVFISLPSNSSGLAGTVFEVSVSVVTPSTQGFLPSEPSAALLVEDGLSYLGCGPVFEGSGTLTPPPLEVYMNVVPTATVTQVADHMEGRESNAVIVSLIPGATLRGFDLRNQPRDLTLSIRVSSFFVISGVSSVADASKLGTDRTPAADISVDQREVTFVFGGTRSIAFGHVVYQVRLFVTNPPWYFWAVTSDEPWIVTLEQGPRLGCQGCPSVQAVGSLPGPRVDFAIRQFHVLPTAVLAGARGDFLFQFQLLYDAAEFVLHVPTGFVPLSCAFHAPATLDVGVQLALSCAADAGEYNSSIVVTSRPPGRGMGLLPVGVTLVFRSLVDAPTVFHAASLHWNAVAMDMGGSPVAQTIEDAVMWTYEDLLPAFSVVPNDKSPNATSVVSVSFSCAKGMQPGDILRVSAPLEFHWLFAASEFSPTAQDSQAALPVRGEQAAQGTSNILSLSLVGSLDPDLRYGFTARVMHSLNQPVHNQWLLETYGPAAATQVEQRYEVAQTEAYSLSLLVDVEVSPWTFVRAATGPVTISFMTTQSVPAMGRIMVRSPPEFVFTSTCSISGLRLGQFSAEGLATIIPSTAAECTVVTPNEVRIRLTTTDPNGFRGLDARVRYTVTVHSLTNSVNLATLAPQQWHLETRSESERMLDVTSRVAGFVVGETLLHAELTPGGVSTGADPRAGARQWVTISFRVVSETRANQLLQIFAAPGFQFDSTCELREAPAYVVPGANAVADQLSDCVGIGANAELIIQAVWHLRDTHVFQIQVTNSYPTPHEVSALEEPFLNRWRLCLDQCQQMHTDLISAPVRGFQFLDMLSTSNVYGGDAKLVVSFVLSTSTPPLGKLVMEAPGGFQFSQNCSGFDPQSRGGFFGLPPATTCRSLERGFGRRLFQRHGAQHRRLQSSPSSGIALSLGVDEGDRLLVNKPYVFVVGVQNPDANNQPQNVSWTLSTLSDPGELVDFVRIEDGTEILGVLLHPLFALPLEPVYLFAGVQHSIRVMFRTLRADEGGYPGLPSEFVRIDVFAPHDRDQVDGASSSSLSPITEWDLTSPSACTQVFTASDGTVSQGLRHGNITTPGGALVCQQEGRLAISLTFRPSAMSPNQLSTIEFAIRNPERSPDSLWNRWRVRLARIRPSILPETLNMDVAFLAGQTAMFEDLSEANYDGFFIVPKFVDLQISATSYAVNTTAFVTISFQTHSVVSAGSILAIEAPSGFTIRDVTVDDSFPTTDGLVFLPPSPGAASSQAHFLFSVDMDATQEALNCSISVANPALPTSPDEAPLWICELLSSAEEDASVLERTADLRGYDVHLSIEVAGLFGSVREVGSQYNFVRLTFALPSPLPPEGVLRIRAPAGFTLLAEGFSRENLPPFTEPVTSPGPPSRELDIFVLYGLAANSYYALRVGAENPATQIPLDPWQFWCYTSDGAVVAANRQVPAFGLEARFQSFDVLPSSVTPLKTHIVEVQMQLDSSPLFVTAPGANGSGSAVLVIELPPETRPALQSGDGADAELVCRTGVHALGPAEDIITTEATILVPLPADSQCRVAGNRTLSIEVNETLELGHVYRFALEVENPLETPQGNTWRVSTERNGAMLHLAVDVSSYEIATVSAVDVISTDVRLDAVQLLLVVIHPPRHLRGSSAIEVAAPSGFHLRCEQQGESPPPGIMPNGTECLSHDGALRMTLPPPVLYAPYTPVLLAGEEYYFAVFCANPPEATASVADLNFQVRLLEEWPVGDRLLGLRADMPAPSLATSLRLLSISPVQVAPAGGATDITVRFQLPAGAADTSGADGVRAIQLEGPPGMKLSDGVSRPCTGFGSQVEQAGDAVLPQSVCSGASESSVVIQMPEPLQLGASDGNEPVFVFQLQVQSPEVELPIDSFLLALLPGPGAAPLFASSAAGFQGDVLGLEAAVLPVLPPEYAALASPTAAPTDSDLPPLSTVILVASAAARSATPFWMP